MAGPLALGKVGGKIQDLVSLPRDWALTATLEISQLCFSSVVQWL